MCQHINNDLIEAGYKNTKVEIIKYKGDEQLINCERNENNGSVNRKCLHGSAKVVAEFDIFYQYDENSWSHKWLRGINIIIK